MMAPTPHTTTITLQARPGYAGGALCFTGTKIRVETLFNYLRDGGTVDEFLKEFEGAVEREQVVCAIENGGLETRTGACKAALIRPPITVNPLPRDIHVALRNQKPHHVRHVLRLAYLAEGHRLVQHPHIRDPRGCLHQPATHLRFH